MNDIYQQIDSRDDDGNVTGTSFVTNPVAPDGTPNQLIFVEEYVGDSPKPRVAVGIGVNWNSPFGPLRIDFSKTLVKVEGDDPKTFNFNVGTQF